MGNTSSTSVPKEKLLEACWELESSNLRQFLELLKEAIQSEEAYQYRDQEGHSVLHICVIKGFEKPVQIVATAFPRLITSSNHKSISPLHSAISLRHFSIASLLLGFKDRNMLYQTDDVGNNAFHHACLVDNLKLLEEMLEIDSDPVIVGMKNTKSETPLLLALKHTAHPIPFVQLLLRHHPQALHSHDRDGNCALLVATSQGDLSLVKFLLTYKGAIGVTSKDGKGVLHFAACGGFLDIFRFFLEETNVPVNVRDVLGNSPLHYAVLQPKFVECVNLLIQKGGDIHFKNRNSQNPLEFLKANIQSNELHEQDFQSMIKLLEGVYSNSPEPPFQGTQTLKLQFCSDIHVEFGTSGTLNPKGSILALLGDIGVTSKSNYRKYLLQQSELFEKVFVISGNHEAYNNSIEQTYEDITKTCQETEKLMFMNNNSLVIGNIRFLGTTLWSQVLDEQNDEVSVLLNDYRRIRIENRLLKTFDTVKWHKESVNWIKVEIEIAKKEGQQVVVLTHHCPLWKLGCCAPSDYDSPCYSAFCSDLSALFGPPVLYWLYGHTHWFNDITINGTRIISNPGGYPQEKMPFDNTFSVDIPLSRVPSSQ